MVRQGLWEAAIAFAEGVRDTSNSRHDDNFIDHFCEGLLIQHGRTDEAYRKYGLRAASGTTNLAIYRALGRQYPDRDRRQILLDLIESRGDKGNGSQPRRMRGFSISPSNALEPTERTPRRWFAQLEISAKLSLGSLPRSH